MDNDDTRHEALARVVAAYAARPDVSVDDIAALTVRMTETLGLAPAAPAAPAVPSGAAVPAVPLDRAVTHDRVFCLCCGKGFRMLKRHIGAEHGLTEAEYRARFGLPEEFPLTAPSYSRIKADYAKKAGLGKYVRQAAPAEG